MKRIILIGFMGCGKTSVGKRLAHSQKLPFVDMDEKIVERLGMPITEIFARYGETYFREIETQVLHQLMSQTENCVISAGGGVPMQQQNRIYMKEHGLVIYLKAAVDTLVDRLQDDTSRPMLHGGDLRAKIIALQSARTPVYEAISDIQVDTDGKELGQIVREIHNILAKK